MGKFVPVVKPPVKKANKLDKRHRYGAAVDQRAMQTLMGQKQRCTNPKNISYPSYGAKGIKVEYSNAEFYKWWSENIHLVPEGIRPSVGRLDHSKNYSLDNIEMQTVHSNSREVMLRVKPVSTPPRKIGLFSKRTKECIAIFNSIASCAEFVGCNQNTLVMNCQKENPRGSQKYSWYYRYV